MTDNPFDKFSRRQTLAALFAAGMIGPMGHPAAAADFGAFNAGHVRHIVLPALANLQAAATQFYERARRESEGLGGPDIDALKAGFNDLADAWASAQMFRFGPLADAQRAERFAYWPERRNIIDKQLSALLASGDAAALTAERLGEASVAVQGLPALERLLYSDNLRDAAGFSVVIAGNLQLIATEVADAWRSSVDNPAPFAANPAEATTQFYTNLLTLLQIVAEQKIGVPLGTEVAAAKPKAAEQWRSGRSLRNIRLNLAAARAGFLDDGGFAALVASDDLRGAVDNAFAEAIAAAARSGDDLAADVTDPARRLLVTELLVRINKLRDLLRQDVPPAIGITLGFNELDGDGS
jgi:predicted lipoprotein